jgi:alkanesulfonate monooxygenase SsuD/methylene tetrahydromethanopterin reductase-like flavin-dependent oxidoreductase (luciferase family)
MLPDPLMALTAAAVATDRIELGTGIMQLPIRNVVEVAHRVLTLEVLAPGRVLFGVGPGSTERDFEVFGGDFSTRFAVFDEQWLELQQWIRDGRIGDLDLAPTPGVLGGPTLMLAGWRGRWVERAAVESAGWIASAVYADDEQLADGIARYRDAGGERAVVTNIQVGQELEPTIDRLGRLAELGFDDAVVLDLTPSRDRLAAIRDSFDG